MGLLLLWIFINSFDETLAPGIQTVLAERNTPVQSDQNLYFAMLGFDVAGDVNINVLGQRMFAANATALVHGHSELNDLYKAVGVTRVEFSGDVTALCGVGGQEQQPYRCLEKAATKQHEIEQLLESNETLLKRYRLLYAYSRSQWYPDINGVKAPPPNWAPMFKAKRLLNSAIALKVQGGQFDSALDDLVQDTRFFRQILDDPDLTALEKLIFRPMLLSNLSLASEMIRSRILNDRQRERLNGIVTPLTLQERSFAAEFRDDLQSEARDLPTYTRSIDYGILPKGIPQHFYQPNATLNGLYKRYQEDIRVDSMSLPATSLQTDIKNAAGREDGAFSWNILYNPIGRGLLENGNYELYWIADMIDLEGVRRLVALQLEIRNQGVGDSAIEAYLQHAGADFANPYTGKPMTWDATTRTLSFKPGREHNQKYAVLPL